MMTHNTATIGDRLAALLSNLETKGTLRRVQRMVNSMHAGEIATLLESLPPPKRAIVWRFVDPEKEGDVLVELNEQARTELIDGMDAEQLVAAVDGLDLDDLADLFEDLPETVNERVLRSMDAQDRERLGALLAYDDNTAGGLMNTDSVTVRPDVTLEVVLRYLRIRGQLPDRTDRLFVVNRSDAYVGTLDVTRLLTEDPERLVAEMLDTSIAGIPAAASASHVATLFRTRDLTSAAVINHNGILLGRITIDDVVDVIREQADHNIKSLANLQDEEDLFSPIIPSARRRGVWIGANVVAVLFVSNVVANFSPALEKIAALAVLMPVIASMGGIAGTQTVTLIVRGLGLGQLSSGNTRWLLGKEVTVAALNAIVWGFAVSIYTFILYREWKLVGVVCAALFISLLSAAIVGVSVPLALKKFRIDPALASGVFLTAFTDCIGFASLLGLGSLYLVSM